MNENNLQRFYNYLCAVVKYYQTHKSLKNFSNLAREFKVKAITRELFFQFDLDKEEGEPTRELSDKIRLLMAEIDMKHRREQLEAFINSEHPQDAPGVSEKNAFEKYEERLTLIFQYRQDVIKAIYDMWGKVDTAIMGREPSDLPLFGPAETKLEDLLMLESWRDQVEYEAAKEFFGGMDNELILRELPTMSEPVIHSFLTYIFGDEDGTQLKFDFDARGEKSESNDALEQAMAEYGIFNEVAFHKLESWKGCGHMCIVYKDAPDILMIIGDQRNEYYTIEDDIFYSYCGNTVIDPGVNCLFGGWGTRSIMATCIRAILLCKYEAMYQQDMVPKHLRGKLLGDLRHADDIRAMYREEWERKGSHQ